MTQWQIFISEFGYNNARFIFYTNSYILMTYILLHAAGLSLISAPVSTATPANLHGILYTVIQSMEQFFVVNRDNSIISVFNQGYLGEAVQILQHSGSVTLDRSHAWSCCTWY